MNDLDRLQGAWKVTSLEIDGIPMSAPDGACVVLKGSRFQSLGMGAVYEGEVEINPGSKPKQFDLIFTSGPEQGNRSPGIYELNGDEWKLCLAVTGKTRPVGFATAPGSGHALETLRRSAAQPAESSAETARIPAPTSAALADSAPELEGEWQMTACIADGYPVPDAMVKTGRRVARGGETSSYFGKQRLMQARYGVDRGSQPHAIDYYLTNGNQQFGIWKFEGDILQICFAQPGKARPADFTASRGKGHTFTAWKRIT